MTISKKVRIALVVFAILLIVALIGVGIWLGIVRNQSSKYNLITLKGKSVPTPCQPNEDGFVELTDLNLHYVKFGDAEQSLILLHGNGGSVKSLWELASYIANDFTVYCIESRCHGQSGNPDEITYDLMAKDVYEFICAKGLTKPYVMGHSDGGIVAITLASVYPDAVGAIISCGANSRPQTLKSSFLTGVKIKNSVKRDKLNDLILNYPNFTQEFLARIKVPTYIVCAEFDIVKLSDSVYMHENIKGSKIAVIKWAGHSSYISQDGKQAYVLAHEFFASLNV